LNTQTVDALPGGKGFAPLRALARLGLSDLLQWLVRVLRGGTDGDHSGGAPVSPRAPHAVARQGQALVEYVLLFSGVVILCIVALALIGQAIPWSSITDGMRHLP
jgi:hypothetical protein